MQEELYDIPKKTNSLLPLFILFGMAVLPGFIASLITYYILFLKLKQKPIVTYTFLAVVSFFIFIWNIIAHPLTSINLSNHTSFMTAYMFLCSIAYVILTFLIVFHHARQLKIYPELKVMKGWAYNFNYKKTPYELYQRKQDIKSLKAGEEYSYDSAPLGILADKVFMESNEAGDVKYFDKERIVRSYYTERCGHTAATGQTGAGKTYTMLQLMRNDIEAGFPVFAIDFKKGTEYPYYLAKWAKEHGRQFYHFTAGKPGTYNNPFCDNQASYDPLATGTATSKADMMLNLRQWDGASEVYKKRTKDILESIFYLLENVDKEKTKQYINWHEGGLSQFVSALQIKNLFALIEQFKLDIANKEHTGQYVSGGDKRRLSALLGLYQELSSPQGKGLLEQINGLVSNCRTLIMSSYGDWLAKGETPYHINLFEFATSDEAPVVLFSFNPQEESDFAKYMGSIILSDLSRTSAYKNAQGNKDLVGVYLDEFQILDPATVADLLEKARSSKMYILLSLQSLEQIVKSSSANGTAVRDSIVDTIQNFIIHKGAGQNTAEELAKIIGQTRMKKHIESGQRNSSIFRLNWRNSHNARVNTQVEYDWIVSPSDFQKLSAPVKENNYTSTAYYITKACAEKEFAALERAVARKVQIIVDDELLQPIPEDFITRFNNSFDADKNEREYLSSIQIQDENDFEAMEDLDFTPIYDFEDVKEEDFASNDTNSLMDGLEELNIQARTPHNDLIKENRKESLETKKKKVSFDDFV